MAAQEGDWRAGRSSAEQLIHMLDTGALSDCTFRVGHPDTPREIRKFKLHRMILSKASAVWERMLLPGAPHMREADTGSVRITDISPRTFHIVLRQVYGDEAALTTLSYPEVQDVLQVADRYLVPALVSACEARICQGELITPDTVWSALSLVDSLHGLDRTRGACVKVLRTCTKECLESPGFLTSCESHVQLLLSQEALSLDSEFPLVCAVLRWAKKRCLAEARAAATEPRRARSRSKRGATPRSVLLPRLLPLLRLAACSLQELETIISLSDWLTQEEVQALDGSDVTYFPPTLCREVLPREVLSTGSSATQLHGPILTLARAVLHPDQLLIFHAPDFHPAEDACVVEASRKVWLHGFTLRSQTKHYPSLHGITLVEPCEQYVEDLELKVYQMSSAVHSSFYAAQHLSSCTTHVGGPTAYDSDIEVSLPSPVCLGRETKVVLVVRYNSRGYYLHQQLSQFMRKGLIDFSFHTQTLGFTGPLFLKAITYRE